MKKSLILTILVFSILFGTCSKSLGGQTTKLPVSKHTFQIGLENRYFDYEEKDGDLMEEEGYFVGISGKYAYHRIASKADSSFFNIMGSFELDYLIGDLEYSGQTWSGTPLEADTDDWLLEPRFLLGLDFSNQYKRYLTTLYTGAGYRYWNNEIGGPGGYEREVGYLYQPIGIRVFRSLGEKYRLKANLEYDLFWQGWVKSHLSDVNSGYNNPEVTPDSGYGFRFSLQVKRRISRKYSLAIEPYLRHWNIDNSEKELLTLNSEPKYLVREPENNTTTLGLSIEFLF